MIEQILEAIPQAFRLSLAYDGGVFVALAVAAYIFIILAIRLLDDPQVSKFLPNTIGIAATTLCAISIIELLKAVPTGHSALWWAMLEAWCLWQVPTLVVTVFATWLGHRSTCKARHTGT